MVNPDVNASGVPRAVIGAAVATAIGFMPAAAGMSLDVLPTGAIYGLGWPAFGIVAALLLDREPRSRLGRSLTGFALLPTLVALTAALLTGHDIWARIERTWEWLSVAPIVAALAVTAWGLGLASDRFSRRRLVWLVITASVLVASILVASINAGPRAAATVSTFGLWSVAIVVYELASFRELRPIDESLVDAAIAIAVLLFGAGTGTLVRAGALRAGLPGPDLAAVISAVVSAALILPAGLWLRRMFLERRYGPGALSAADVEQITADIHTQTDVRELLAKAAAMVAAASGHRQVDIVLGPDVPDLPASASLYPLVVGQDRVGTVFLESVQAEGPEPRQDHVVRQLLPTVALVAKAVSLAVEADHARQDLARERDAEQARILGDLHDGIGPMLVGMSMRVRAEVRQRPTPMLEALAGELAACRGDLRRIVSGLAPSVLDDGDLAAALHRLAGSFDGQGPKVTLDSAIHETVSPEIAVAVYRSVAEGISNAVRHARATAVRVDVRTAGQETVLVDVSDDGTGGPIVAGVGLSSLRSRAEKLGGSLEVGADGSSGVRLHLELPTGTATP